MKNKRAVKILFAMLAMLFFVLVSKSFNSVDAAETASFGPPFAHSYIMSGDWVAYCREHGKALGGKVGNISSLQQDMHYIVVQLENLFNMLFGIQNYGLEERMLL